MCPCVVLSGCFIWCSVCHILLSSPPTHLLMRLVRSCSIGCSWSPGVCVLPASTPHPWAPTALEYGGLTGTTVSFSSLSYPKLWLTAIFWYHLLEYGGGVMHLLWVSGFWAKDKGQSYWAYKPNLWSFEGSGLASGPCNGMELRDFTESAYHLGLWKHMALVPSLAQTPYL